MVRPKGEQPFSLEDLMEVMARLRDPKGGCPWDLAQDFRSILPYTLEEAYEVADAIDREDFSALREELGDLLFQSVYHAQMASEAGHFNLHQVIDDLARKMIARHPHVFESAQAQTPEDVNKIWDSKKSGEKPRDSALDGVAAALPALLRAEKLQSRAAKQGFTWKDAREALSKIEEELQELREAIAAQDAQNTEEEIGDCLFVLANAARLCGVNPEEALRKANTKFERRFRGMEDMLKAGGRSMKDLDLESLLALWREVKAQQR